MLFKLPRSAVKAGLKLRFGRCKRNTPTSLAAANRSFAAPISAPRASTIGLLWVPLRSAEKATRLCSGLKAAGGDCIIQKNSTRAPRRGRTPNLPDAANYEAERERGQDFEGHHHC